MVEKLLKLFGAANSHTLVLMKSKVSSAPVLNSLLKLMLEMPVQLLMLLPPPAAPAVPDAAVDEVVELVVDVEEEELPEVVPEEVPVPDEVGDPDEDEVVEEEDEDADDAPPPPPPARGPAHWRIQSSLAANWKAKLKRCVVTDRAVWYSSSRKS
jgi:hypothetical protein